MVKLTDIRTQLPFRMVKTSIENVKDIAEPKYGDVWDFEVYLPTKEKNLQRPLVWSLFQKQQLVLSVLKGIKLAPISIIKYKEDSNSARVFKVIDGKQRVTTLVSFYKGEFAIDFKGEIIYYNDLDERAQMEIWNFQFEGDMAFEYKDEPISDDNKIAWFEMINFSGTPQDVEHLNNLKK